MACDSRARRSGTLHPGRLRGNEGEENILAEAEFQDIRSVSQLEKKAGNRTSYRSMLTGRGSGDLDTGRRVQLVI